jgi:hypothetical protein
VPGEGLGAANLPQQFDILGILGFLVPALDEESDFTSRTA